jgi:nicotinamide mononucleotide transporter
MAFSLPDFLNQPFWEVLGYSLSFLELFGTITGLLTVWLAARAHVLTWPTGLVNNLAFFLIFYQVQLYSDMLLQIYFFVISLYGWWYWQKNPETKTKNISVLTLQQHFRLVLGAAMAVVLLGFGMSDIHQHLPRLLPQPAAYPYADACTTVLSILATGIMARKKIECWVLWILVDGVSIGLYSLQGIRLIALEYVVFLIICIFGFIKWFQLYAHRTGSR